MPASVTPCIAENTEDMVLVSASVLTQVVKVLATVAICSLLEPQIFFVIAVVSVVVSAAARSIPERGKAIFQTGKPRVVHLEVMARLDTRELFRCHRYSALALQVKRLGDAAVPIAVEIDTRIGRESTGT